MNCQKKKILRLDPTAQHCLTCTPQWFDSLAVSTHGTYSLNVFSTHPILCGGTYSIPIFTEPLSYSARTAAKTVAYACPIWRSCRHRQHVPTESQTPDSKHKLNAMTTKSSLHQGPRVQVPTLPYLHQADRHQHVSREAPQQRRSILPYYRSTRNRAPVMAPSSSLRCSVVQDRTQKQDLQNSIQDTQPSNLRPHRLPTSFALPS